MKNDEPVTKENQREGLKGPLDEIMREGARKVLHAAIGHEVGACIDRFKELEG